MVAWASDIGEPRASARGRFGPVGPKDNVGTSIATRARNPHCAPPARNASTTRPLRSNRVGNVGGGADPLAVRGSQLAGRLRRTIDDGRNLVERYGETCRGATNGQRSAGLRASRTTSSPRVDPDVGGASLNFGLEPIGSVDEGFGEVRAASVRCAGGPRAQHVQPRRATISGSAAAGFSNLVRPRRGLARSQASGLRRPLGQRSRAHPVNATAAQPGPVFLERFPLPTNC